MTTLGDSIMDSRDLDDELEALIADGPGQDLDDIQRRRVLRELRAETEGEGWKWGIAFIRDDYFEDYARELADDIGAVGRDAGWPSSYIDWDAASEALKMDYTPIEIDGVDYWYREA